jgi:hypothetical protein
LAEIAYLSLHDTNIELAAILDDHKVGKKFFNHTVQAADVLESALFDNILLTTSEFADLIINRLKEFDIEEDCVVVVR